MPSENERFKKMVEDSQDLFWEFDENANITYSSPSLRNLLGYEPEETLGLNVFDLMSADEVKRIREYFDPIAEKRLPFKNIKITSLHKDGHQVVLESSGTPLFDDEGQFRGYRGIDRDITARTVATDALRESEEFLSKTQDLAHVGSWQLDHRTNRLTWSDETCRIFGFEPESFDDSLETFLGSIHPDDRASVEAAYLGSIRERRDGYELGHRIVKRDTGEIRYVHEKCSNEFDVNGTIIRSVGMVQDVTERKIGDIALNEATRTAENANRAKSLFLANMSHEIRTPMTAILGFGELLQETELTQEQERYLEMINAAGNSLLSLINDVLDLSKIDAGKLLVKAGSFDLHGLIKKLGDVLELQVAQKNLSFRASIDSDVPTFLVGDQSRIRQILLNLLSNAIKFTDEGTISVAVSVAEKSDTMVLLDIAVKDTGIGVSEDCLKQVFEPFFQVNGPRTRTCGGAGLGLAISRSLAALMGGSVRGESQEGSGSTFHLLVPLQCAADTTSEKISSEKEPLSWNGPSLKILLAEDNPINIQFIKIVLENMGHAVTVAENGKVALDVMMTNTFDLVLMDVQMPVMDGIHALRALRKQEQIKGEHLTVVALTAFALIGDREKYLNMGFDGYLSKPLTIQGLVKELMRVVPR